MNECTYTDTKGRTWKLFDVQYYHEVDDMYMTFHIWAIDMMDAIDRLEYIKNGAKVMYEIDSIVK